MNQLELESKKQKSKRKRMNERTNESNERKNERAMMMSAPVRYAMKLP
jgi:hypothetical protein